jgi:hypothetical protein
LRRVGWTRMGWISVCALGMSCAGSPNLVVQVTQYPEFKTRQRVQSCGAKLAESSVEILTVEDAIPDGCVQVGDIFIGDSGWSRGCEPRDLTDRLRLAACQREVSTVKVLHLTEPYDDSYCYQLRAGMLMCESESGEPQ